MPMMKPVMEGNEPRPLDTQDEGPQEQPGAETPPESGAPKDNPVIDALKTLQIFIAAQKQKGNPQADAMVQAFQAFLQSMGAGGKGPEQAPSPGPTPPPTDEGGPMPMDRTEKSVPIV